MSSVSNAVSMGQMQITIAKKQLDNIEQQGKDDEGRAMQLDAARALRLFYRDELPKYRWLIGAGK